MVRLIDFLIFMKYSFLKKYIVLNSPLIYPTLWKTWKIMNPMNILENAHPFRNNIINYFGYYQRLMWTNWSSWNRTYIRNNIMKKVFSINYSQHINKNEWIFSIFRNLVRVNTNHDIYMILDLTLPFSTLSDYNTIINLFNLIDSMWI